MLVESLFNPLMTLVGVFSSFNATSDNLEVKGQWVPPGRWLTRKAALGNPDYSSVQLSPDGSYMTYLSPWQNVLNLYVKRLPDGEPRRLTSDLRRSIAGYGWTYLPRTVVFSRDNDGDENWRFYAMDVETGESRLLTQTSGVAAQVLAGSNRFPDEIVIGLNDRDPRYHDAYRLNMTTGRRELLFKNNDCKGFLFDLDLQLRMLIKENDNATVTYYMSASNGSSNNDSDFLPYRTFETDDELSYASHFDDTGRLLYWIETTDGDKSALIVEYLDNATRHVIYRGNRSDIAGVLTEPLTGRPLLITENYLKPTKEFVDDSIADDFEFLNDRFPNKSVSISSSSLDYSLWLLTIWSDQLSPKLYFFNRTDQSVEYLLSFRKQLDDYPFSPMFPVEIPVADSLIQVCYLNLPRWSDPDEDGLPDQPLPMVLSVHGGPWAKVSYGLDLQMQLLASRGYAVLTCNFRGSTGYGKRYYNAGNGQWGKKMQQDLTDAVAWAVSKNISDPNRIAIMGGSYGGYATLAGLAYTPDIYACGVDIVGPSNLITLMDSLPPYWLPQRRSLIHRLGADPSTAEGRAFLRAVSPLFAADRIKRPVLIGQGANDPRVKKNESDQIAEALRANRVPFVYALFPDEGHGFARQHNNLAFQAVTEQFLARCLGGFAEPVGDSLAGSSIEFEEISAFDPSYLLPLSQTSAPSPVS